jgi:hypothetical protein
MVIMADTAGPFRAVGNFAVDVERTPIDPPYDNLFMQRNLGGNRGRIKEGHE